MLKASSDSMLQNTQCKPKANQLIRALIKTDLCCMVNYLSEVNTLKHWVEFKLAD